MSNFSFNGNNCCHSLSNQQAGKTAVATNPSKDTLPVKIPEEFY